MRKNRTILVFQPTQVTVHRTPTTPSYPRTDAEKSLAHPTPWIRHDDPRNLWKDYKERLELLGGKGYWGELSEEEMEEVED